MLFMGGSIYSSLRETAAFLYPHDPRAGVQRENGTGAYIPCESLGTGLLAEKQFSCTIPGCTALCSREATHTKCCSGTAHEKSVNTPYFDTLVTFL